MTDTPQPDPLAQRARATPDRTALVVIISDGDAHDHGELYTTAALTGSDHYGQNRYA